MLISFRAHKVRMHKEYHSACPLVGIGILPAPLSPPSVPLPPEPGEEGAHSPGGEGLGKSQFQRLEKKLSTLPILCGLSPSVSPPSYLPPRIRTHVLLIGS
jgi:hypothetical protein